MYQRIMAAIDSGFATSRVLEAGIQMARKFDARLALCHALDDTILAQKGARVALPDGVSPVEDFLYSGAREFMERAVATTREKGVEAEIRLLESEVDHVPEMLVRAATEWQADLLIVGSHGSYGLERFLGGTIAEQLVRKAGISLLLVRS